MIQAMTGTGKSVGYLLGLLNEHFDIATATQSLLSKNYTAKHWEMNALVVVPNAILAAQLARWAAALIGCSDSNALKPQTDTFVRVPSERLEDVLRLCLSSASDQASAMAEFGATSPRLLAPGKVPLVIGTPKALFEARAKGILRTDSLQRLVIDEADQMCPPPSRYNCLQEIQKKIRHPNSLQSLLEALGLYGRAWKKSDREIDSLQVIVVSATLSGTVRQMFRRKMGGLLSSTNTVFVHDHLAQGREATISCPEAIKHQYRLCGNAILQMAQLLQSNPQGHETLIFVSAGESKIELIRSLQGCLDGSFYVGLLQDRSRELMLEPLLEKRSRVWVASDVDARGLDIPNLENVAIYGVAASDMHYVHMAGRVGRMGRPGRVISLLRNPAELSAYTSMTSKLRIHPEPILDQ